MEFRTNLDGKHGPTTYELTDTAVLRRSQVGDETAELRDVARVSLNEFQGTGFCELSLQTGGTFHVSSGGKDHGAANDYIAFARALHERLAASGRGVRFVSGSWFIVTVYVVIIAALATFAGLVHFDVITPPSGFVFRSKVLLVIAAIGVAGAPILIAKTRPKPYDPHDLPDRALPSS